MSYLNLFVFFFKILNKFSLFCLCVSSNKSKLRAQSPAFQAAVSSVSADSVNAPEFVPRFTTGKYLVTRFLCEHDLLTF